MNHAPTTPFQKFKQRAEAAGYNVEQIASGGYFIDGKTQDAWEGWKLCMDQQEADDGAEVERLAAQSAPTDEIRRYVIQQKTGEVPRLLGPCPNKRVVESLLRESYTAYPDCICIVVDMPVTAYPQHGREWLDMYGDKRKPRLASPPAHAGDAPNPAQTGCAAGTEDECVRRDCATACPALQSTQEQGQDADPDLQAVYVLVARMFRQPNEVLRSMMAQDLCRILKMGFHAADKETREAHIAAARQAIERDMQDADPAEQVRMFEAIPREGGGTIVREGAVLPAVDAAIRATCPKVQS